LAYRFTFNGKEKDNDTYGAGNTYDFGSRIYDARLGRWFSMDPQFNLYPDQSTYVFCVNNPLLFVDPNGEYIVVSTRRFKMIDGKKVELKGLKSIFIKADIIEKTVTFHQVKIIDLTGKIGGNELDNLASELESGIKDKWSTKSNKDVNHDKTNPDYILNKRGQKLKVTVTFAQSISVITSPDKVEKGDNIIAIVDEKDPRLGGAGGTISDPSSGGKGIMFVSNGMVNFFDGRKLNTTEYYRHSNVVPHEAGHWMGLPDNYIDNDRLMYNRNDSYDNPNNSPTFNELKKIEKNSGFVASNKGIDFTLRPSKRR